MVPESREASIRSKDRTWGRNFPVVYPRVGTESVEGRREGKIVFRHEGNDEAAMNRFNEAICAVVDRKWGPAENCSNISRRGGHDLNLLIKILPPCMRKSCWAVFEPKSIIEPIIIDRILQ